MLILMVWGSGCASAVTQTVLSKHPDVSAEALCQGKNLDWSPRGLPTFLADFQLFHLKVYQERRVIITDKRQLWVAKNGFSMCFGCLPHFSLWIFLCDEVQFQITVLIMLFAYENMQRPFKCSLTSYHLHTGRQAPRFYCPLFKSE